jgi:hypothetical protein
VAGCVGVSLVPRLPVLHIEREDRKLQSAGVGEIIGPACQSERVPLINAPSAHRQLQKTDPYFL